MKFLLIQTAFIGDAILATALVEKLRYHYPDAQIDFLLRKGNESLFEGNTAVNEVIIWDKKQKYRSLFSVWKQVRQGQYDKVICLQRFATMGLLTAFSGAKQSIGFDKNPFSWLFSKRIPHTIAPGVHEVERNTALIAWFTDNQVFRPKLYPKNLSWQPQKPYICIAPTSVWFTKQFPENQWVKLIRAIPNKYQIYLLGAKSDTEACERMCVGTNTQNLAGKLSLLESAALMQGAVLNFVNDSAPMHLCSATNAPVCAVYCSTVPAFGFGPLSDFSRIVEVTTPLPCRPCGLHGYQACPQGHFRCGQDIQTAQLLAVLQEAENLFAFG